MVGEWVGKQDRKAPVVEHDNGVRFGDGDIVVC